MDSRQRSLLPQLAGFERRWRRSDWPEVHLGCASITQGAFMDGPQENYNMTKNEVQPVLDQLAQSACAPKGGASSA